MVRQTSPLLTKHASHPRSRQTETLDSNVTKLTNVYVVPTVRTLHEITACTAMVLTVSKVTVKVNQTLYRPGQTLRFPACWGSQISRQLAHECDKVVRTMHRPPLPPRNIPGTHFCRRLSRPPGPWCSRKDYGHEKFQWHSQELNPRPSGLQHSSTAYPNVSRNI